MKIISPGQGTWRTRVICQGCKAKLEFETEDITYAVSDADAANQQYNLDIEGSFYATCPLCWTDIKIRKLPPLEKNTIKARGKNL